MTCCVGPTPSKPSALELVAGEHVRAELVDINLNGTADFVVADALVAAKIPIALVTGYHQGVVPARFASCEHLEKPVAIERAVGCCTT